MFEKKRNCTSEYYHYYSKPEAIWGKSVTFQSQCLPSSLEVTVALGLTSKSRDTFSSDNPQMLWTKDWDWLLFPLEHWLFVFIIREKLINENHSLFLQDVCLEREQEICSCLYLWRLFSLRFCAVHTSNVCCSTTQMIIYLFIKCFFDCTLPPRGVTLSPCWWFLSTLKSLLIVVGLFILEIK